MKKSLFLVLLLIGSALTAFAQPELRFGIDAGVNLSRIKSYDFKSITAYRVGGKVEYILPMTKVNAIYLTSGLYLAKKGAKVNDYRYCKINSNYIDIPLHIGFRQRISSDFKLFEEFGPYISFGLFGKSELGDFVDAQGVKYEGSKFNTFDELKRTDAGVGLKLGVEYNDMIQVSIGMDWGLVRVMKQSEILNLSKGQNYSAYLTVGYVF